MDEPIRSEYPEQQIERLAGASEEAGKRFYMLSGVPYVIERTADGSIEARSLLGDLREKLKFEARDKLVSQGHPDHVEGTAKLASGASLIEWCRRFGCKAERSALFAQRQTLTIRAVADYHQEGATPAWQRHQAVFTATATEAAKTWLKTIETTADGLDQLLRRWGFMVVDQAAEKDEDGYKPSLRVLDLKGKPTLAPSASDLITWSASLDWAEHEEAVIDRASGTIKSTKTASGSAFDKVGFWLRFAVFVGEPSIDIQIGMAPRIVKSKLIYTLWPMLGASVVEDAFKAMGDRIAAATTLYLFEGEPEAPQVLP